MTTAEPLAKPVVLDCTLRDGGHYNAWDFDRPVVERYLAAASEAGVPVIEIGFRSMPQEQFLGAYAYSSDAVLEDLPLPAGAEIVVMVNASELLAHDGGPVAAVDMLFRSAEVSPVSRVRLAAHFDELAACGDIARRLKDLGYGVAVNLMQATGRSDDALAEAAAQVADWDAADVLYFADSLGTMTPDDTRRMVAALRRGWPGDLGIHTHDNRGQALANSLAAIDEGVAWVDSTVLGMGRGAGNTPTEYLLLELARRGDNRFRPDALFSVVAGDFAGLREQYRWGCNLFYYLSAMEGVHPTYVQQMLAHERYGSEDIVAAIRALGEGHGGRYSGASLHGAVARAYTSADGAWSADGWARRRTVLLLAAAPGAERHRDVIAGYVQRAGPIVVCLNHAPFFPPELVDAYACCHPTRLLTLAETYRQLGRPVIAPMAATVDGMRDLLSEDSVLDYGMAVEHGTFHIGPHGCTVPEPLVVPYALSVAAAAGAERILLAGFDGYQADDPRHREMNDLLTMFGTASGGVPLMAVTPTTYAVPQGSIYMPDL